MQKIRFLKDDDIDLVPAMIGSVDDAIETLRTNDIGLTGFIAEETRPSGRVFAYLYSGNGPLRAFYRDPTPTPAKRRMRRIGGKIKQFKEDDRPA